MLRTRIFSVISVILMLGFVNGVSVSYATSVTLVTKPLTDLLGAGPIAVDTLMTTVMSSGGLASEVLSQAYRNDSGQYAYLYQIDNDLPASSAFVELFSLAPFYGATENIQMGYLTGDMPSGFSAGGEVPEPTGNVKVSVGPTVSFYYGDRDDYSILAGEYSVVMYVMSELSEDEITGNVIDGDVGTGNVVGPVPEPATIALLGLGGLALLRKRRK